MRQVEQYMTTMSELGYDTTDHAGHSKLLGHPIIVQESPRSIQQHEPANAACFRRTICSRNDPFEIVSYPSYVCGHASRCHKTRSVKRGGNRTVRKSDTRGVLPRQIFTEFSAKRGS